MFFGHHIGIPAVLSGDTFIDPSSYAGLTNWYDASDASTITKDGSNFVSQWRDKSGGSRHLAQGTTGNQPTWTANEQNSMPAIACLDTGTAGTCTRMIGSTSQLTSEVTLFVVMKVTALVGTNDGYFGGGGVGNLFCNSTDLNWTTTDSTDGSGAVRLARKLTEGSYIVFSMRRSAAQNNAELRENGALIKRTTHTGTTTTSTGLRIGFDASNNFATASYAEIVIYNQWLNDSQMANVEAWLNTKWAVFNNFTGSRDLNLGVRRYATANGISSLAGLPSVKRLFVIMGQSNSAGEALTGSLSPALSNPIANAKIWNYNTPAWETLQVGVNNLPNTTGKHGPELSLMYDLAADFAEVYLLKYGVGGTALADKWLPTAPGSLYVYTLGLLDNALYAAGIATGQRLTTVGFLWYQGESDTTASFAPQYQANEVALFARMRNGTDFPGGDTAKIVVARINNTVYTQYYADVNAAKTTNAANLPNVSLINGWTGTDTIDGIHANSTAEIAVGNAAAVIFGATTQVS